MVPGPQWAKWLAELPLRSRCLKARSATGRQLRGEGFYTFLFVLFHLPRGSFLAGCKIPTVSPGESLLCCSPSKQICIYNGFFFKTCIMCLIDGNDSLGEARHRSWQCFVVYNIHLFYMAIYFSAYVICPFFYWVACLFLINSYGFWTSYMCQLYKWQNPSLWLVISLFHRIDTLILI